MSFKDSGKKDKVKKKSIDITTAKQYQKLRLDEIEFIDENSENIFEEK